MRSALCESVGGVGAANKINVISSVDGGLYRSRVIRHTITNSTKILDADNFPEFRSNAALNSARAGLRKCAGIGVTHGQFKRCAGHVAAKVIACFAGYGDVGLLPFRGRHFQRTTYFLGLLLVDHHQSVKVILQDFSVVDVVVYKVVGLRQGQHAPDHNRRASSGCAVGAGTTSQTDRAGGSCAAGDGLVRVLDQGFGGAG